MINIIKIKIIILSRTCKHDTLLRYITYWVLDSSDNFSSGNGTSMAPEKKNSHIMKIRGQTKKKKNSMFTLVLSYNSYKRCNQRTVSKLFFFFGWGEVQVGAEATT